MTLLANEYIPERTDNRPGLMGRVSRRAVRERTDAGRGRAATGGALRHVGDAHGRARVAVGRA